MDPYLPYIQSDDPHHVKQGAQKLRDWLLARDLNGLYSRGFYLIQAEALLIQSN